MKTEAELIERILNGEWRNFAILADKYEAKVFGYVHYLVGNREDAEEIVQDSFVKAYHSLSKFRGDAAFSTWVMRIAHYGALTRLRLKVPQKVSLEKAEESREAVTDNPSRNLDLEDRDIILNKALNQLKEDERSVITLFYFHESSIREVCDITGFTESNVKILLHRSRKKLLGILKSMGIKQSTL